MERKYLYQYNHQDLLRYHQYLEGTSYKLKAVLAQRQ